MLKRASIGLTLCILQTTAVHADWTLFKSKKAPPSSRSSCATVLAEFREKTDGEADLFFRQLRLTEESDEQGHLSVISAWLAGEEPNVPADLFGWSIHRYRSEHPDLIVSEVWGAGELGFIVAEVPSDVTFLSKLEDGSRGGHPVHALVWTRSGFKIAFTDGDFGSVFYSNLDPFLLKPFGISVNQVRKIIAGKATQLQSASN